MQKLMRGSGPGSLDMLNSRRIDLKNYECMLLSAKRGLRTSNFFSNFKIGKE